MALLVYVTENCEEDARKHSSTPDLCSFRRRVEETQSTSHFDRFPPPYLVKKKFGSRQGRLIAEQRSVGEHSVIIFLAALIRGDRTYKEFADDPKEYGAQHLPNIGDDELQRFVDDRTRTEPPPLKPDPSGDEYAFLYSAFSHQENAEVEDLVYETKEWVAQVSQDRISKQLALLCKPCRDSLSKRPGLSFSPIADKQGWGVWAFRTSDKLLLLTPATEATAAEAESFAKTIAQKLDGTDTETVLRNSRRAYPALMLADDELWIDLEREPVGNMALSLEESAVLDSARRSDTPFPLFINGRAGSGKSTILQYLFTDLLFSHLRTENAKSTSPPIYLTANGDLLRVARNFVERLLRTEATLVLQSKSDVVNEYRDVLDNAFREFQPHLLSLLPHPVRARFARSARVDYARFRNMWKERFGKDRRAIQEFGPDLSWHIIRSYIKGKSSETFLEPDDYPHLPLSQISVTDEAFKTVYDRVWKGWYEDLLEEQKLWDDQDLTRYILENNLAQPLHPAVFCDEAQDFTRVELELLLRLNLFSDRNLKASDISRVPFAFAGDQFQTLNPTGFRWETIKSSFVEKFILELDPAGRSARIDLNYHELQYNYRSTDRIVRFGNQIQALRAALFGLPDLKPQTPWTKDPQSFPVIRFDAEDGNFWKAFKDNPGFVLIVPCNEGEELEFVKNDPKLSENIRIEEGVPINVLSAARAKGCEYPAVIVYGFGNAAERSFAAELQTEEKTSDPDRSLPIQYFINRLYVAVSRPKRRLVIVDTRDGIRKLWKCVEDDFVEESLLAKIKRGREIWGPMIEGMTQGTSEDLGRETVADPLENARTFEADGLARRDGYALRQAAQAYRSAGEILKGRECRARALEMDAESEVEWYDAGEAFWEAGFIPDAIRCWWRAGKDGWNRLAEKTPHNSTMQNQLECEWASAIVKKPNPEMVANLLEKFAKRLDEPTFLEATLGDRSWRDALGAILQPMLQTKRPAPEGDAIWIRISHALDRIRQNSFAIPLGRSAQIYFLAKRYADAIPLWEESGEKSPEYHKAKAAITPYPERILSLASLGSHKEIVDSYVSSPEVELSNEQKAAVSEALRENDDTSRAFDLAWSAEAVTPMLRLVKASLKSHDRDLAGQALHAGLILSVWQNKWETLGKVASSVEFVPLTEWREKEIKVFVQAESQALQITFIRALARANSLEESPSDVRQEISTFLRKFLRVKDGIWKSSLTVAEAGAAFERAGRFTDAIGFYEAVARDSTFGAEDKVFARRRWLMSKKRQLDYEKSQGAKAKVAQIESDIRQEMAALRIANLESLSGFPELPPIDFDRAPAKTVTKTTTASRTSLSRPSGSHADAHTGDPITMTAGVFAFEFSRKLQRCNIKHSETMETAFIKVTETRFGGEVEFRREGSSWFCESWRMRVELPQTPGNKRLTIWLEESGVEVAFDTEVKESAAGGAD